MYKHLPPENGQSNTNLIGIQQTSNSSKVPPLTGCRLLMLAVVVSLCSIIVTVVVFQLSTHSAFGKAGKFTRPPIAADKEHPGITTYGGGKRIVWPDPPPRDQVAKVARYVVHTSEWGSISTISTDEPIKGFPFGNIISISDGPVDRGSGVPYFYLTGMDFTGKDIAADARASLTLSEAQSDYCRQNSYDAEDPRCARVLMAGHMIKVENGTADWSYAEDAVFSRHPDMKDWPKDHQWFFAKLDISNIYVLDYFGGASKVDVNEYLETAWPLQPISVGEE